ncbi:minor capsid protein [Thermomonas sp. XSG]|uniref:phage head morphogenesis protein n=1 Tax=Thermomonas sp. XSG TaxID=2771436 RepID=UPI001680FA9F|nr:minor capsid protein [Thermomonas sp. XSG]QNU15830.1 minor capsid protein [Thermomonas sp. XSG]
MTSRPDLTDQAVRQQVLLERVKAGEAARIDAFLQQQDRRLREILTRASLTAVQRDRIEALLREVRAALEALHRDYTRALTARLDTLAGTVADMEARALGAALEGVDVATPAAPALRAAVTAAPLAVRGAGGGMLLEPFIAAWTSASIERVEGVIRRGYFEGRTTEQIVRDVRGTKAANYRDGILEVNRRNARTVVHTGLQHVAHVARTETMKANADIVKGYRWVSTLDSRTSELCQSLDGRTFDLGEGPLPPAHPNCRSTVVPVTKTFRELGIDVDEVPPGTRASVDGQVPASLTYFEWLKTQPASFVEEALGPTRAAVFLKGGISSDDFATLQLGRNFQPLTIEEMREKAPKVFERAGV